MWRLANIIHCNDLKVLISLFYVVWNAFRDVSRYISCSRNAFRDVTKCIPRHHEMHSRHQSVGQNEKPFRTSPDAFRDHEMHLGGEFHFGVGMIVTKCISCWCSSRNAFRTSRDVFGDLRSRNAFRRPETCFGTKCISGVTLTFVFAWCDLDLERYMKRMEWP